MKWFLCWLSEQDDGMKAGVIFGGMVILFAVIMFAGLAIAPPQKSIERINAENEQLRLQVELERLKANPTKGPATP